MDYREELLNKSLLMLQEEGIGELDRIKMILVRAISDYEITERCTEIAVTDDNNMEMIKLFLATKKIEGGSIETAETRWYILQKFNGDINKPFAEVNTFDILRWLANEQKRVSLSTAEAYRSIISSMFTWLYNSKMIPNNPIINVKPIKHPDPLKRSLSPVEVDALKMACKNNLERAMIELLLSSGLRCQELCNLKWEDINFTTKDISVIGGKGNKNRITMMNDVAKKYLLKYQDGLCYKSEYIFAVKYRGETKQRTTDSVWRKLKEIGDRAGVADISPHVLRHTFASTLFINGLDISMIQQLLGHSSVGTTQRYIHTDLDMLREAYKKYSR